MPIKDLARQSTWLKGFAAEEFTVSPLVIRFIFMGRANIYAGFASLIAGLGLVFVYGVGPTGQGKLTQDDINAAVLHALNTQSLPSRTAKAAELIRPSVVRVRGFGSDPKKPQQGETEVSVGTGVVVKDDGTVLTNLHVVTEGSRYVVTFHDGFESEAKLIGVRPENDLAILKPDKLPDDLQPAVLGSSQELLPGDEVVAVGFPFGMGPSVSAGVVSGLAREFKIDELRSLRGLIQFDAAANSGNSGGPLINMAGEVVGIVTAILNPSGAKTFIGIGFATTIESVGTSVGIPPF